MSIFGKLLAETIEGAVDAVKLTAAVTADTVLAPFQLLMDEDVFELTKSEIERIREED